MKVVNVKMCSICLDIRTGGIDVLPVVSSHCECVVWMTKNALK